MKVLLLLLSLALAEAQGVIVGDACSESVFKISECVALQCPLEACTLPTTMATDDCAGVESMCQAAAGCCDNNCGRELDDVIVNCVPDSVCTGEEELSCSLPDAPDDSTYGLCENADIIGACNALNRTCTQGTNVGGMSKEFCDQCVNGTIANFVSQEKGDCYPIEDITYQNFVDYFQPVLQVDHDDTARLEFLVDIAYFVSAHNSQIPRPSFFLGLNLLAALSDVEIDNRNGLTNAAVDEDTLEDFDFPDSSRRLQSLPASVDWSKTGAVTSVKNQAQCGCCWAVATVGAIEAAVWLTSNETFQESLSWQQLISCDKDNDGCQGGNVITALKYTEDNTFGGVTSNAQYPFTDSKGSTSDNCQADSKELAVDVLKLGRAVTSRTPSDVNDRVTRIKEVLAKTPMAVLMAANCNTFQAYSSGIMTNDGRCACNAERCLDHAVLMVGYDETTNPPSFKIKNSWGTGWGENGYFRIAQTVDQDDMEYGLFGLLFQGSGAVTAINTTVAIDDPDSAATSIQAGSVATATLLSVIFGIAFDFIGW